MKFSIKAFFSKYDQIRRKLRIWSQLLKKSLVETTSFFVKWLLSLRDRSHNFKIDTIKCFMWYFDFIITL